MSTPCLDTLLELLEPRIPDPPRGVWIDSGFMIVCPKCARSKEFRKDDKEPAFENDSTFNCENTDCSRLIECSGYHHSPSEVDEEISLWIDNAPEWRHVRGEEAYRLADILDLRWGFDDEILSRLEILAEAILSTRGQRTKRGAA